MFMSLRSRSHLSMALLLSAGKEFMYNMVVLCTDAVLATHSILDTVMV